MFLQASWRMNQSYQKANYCILRYIYSVYYFTAADILLMHTVHSALIRCVYINHNVLNSMLTTPHYILFTRLCHVHCSGTQTPALVETEMSEISKWNKQHAEEGGHCYYIRRCRGVLHKYGQVLYTTLLCMHTHCVRQYACAYTLQTTAAINASLCTMVPSLYYCFCQLSHLSSNVTTHSLLPVLSYCVRLSACILRYSTSIWISSCC
jgi:hypothetical protein